MERLQTDELVALIERVFEPKPDDTTVAVLVDLPDAELPDNDAWALRRSIAAGWVRELQQAREQHRFDVDLVVYRNVRANNADLPEAAWICAPDAIPAAADPHPAAASSFSDILSSHRIVLAPTELSATAPLKVLSKRFGCRAATMPGFSPDMVPALRIDYAEVNRRVRLLKDLLDRAVGADLTFEVDGTPADPLHLDLRHRMAHASGGLLPDPGTAGNLPSGEAYIVPYEGEIDGVATGSRGRLPIQMDDEVVIFDIEHNVATRVVSEGPVSDRESRLLAAEPARGNLAELGLGVLAAFGIEPIGVVLLDEKLGLHLAFGRSEHFGGQVGPDRFSRAEAVIHQDHVYLPQLQPRINAAAVDLTLDDGSRIDLIRNGGYVLEF